MVPLSIDSGVAAEDARSASLGSAIPAPQWRTAPGEPDAARVERLDFGDLRNRRDFSRQWSTDASEMLKRRPGHRREFATRSPTVAQRRHTGRVPIASLGGITIREFDWGPLTPPGLRPALDPLASVIPADQHAVFFPSVVATLNTMQESRTGGARRHAHGDGHQHRRSHRAPLSATTGYFEPRPRLGCCRRRLSPAWPSTGSDLYFDTGTDTATIYATARASRQAAVGQLGHHQDGEPRSGREPRVDRRRGVPRAAVARSNRQPST